MLATVKRIANLKKVLYTVILIWVLVFVVILGYARVCVLAHFGLGSSGFLR